MKIQLKNIKQIYYIIHMDKCGWMFLAECFLHQFQNLPIYLLRFPILASFLKHNCQVIYAIKCFRMLLAEYLLPQYNCLSMYLRYLGVSARTIKHSCQIV
jgi:hypothetical protein